MLLSEDLGATAFWLWPRPGADLEDDSDDDDDVNGADPPSGEVDGDDDEDDVEPVTLLTGIEGRRGEGRDDQGSPGATAGIDIDCELSGTLSRGWETWRAVFGCCCGWPRGVAGCCWSCCCSFSMFSKY